MAIWQYSLQVIPKQAIIDRYGETPAFLKLNYEGRKHFYKTIYPNNPKAESNLEDAFMINWWKDLLVNANDVKEKINLLFKNPPWEGDNHWSWKGDTENCEDHDMFLSYQNDKVDSLSFRFDLRDRKIFFLRNAIELSQSLDCLLMDNDGKVIEANLDSVLIEIPNSNAAKFLENPEEFLRDFDTTKNQE